MSSIFLNAMAAVTALVADPEGVPIATGEDVPCEFGVPAPCIPLTGSDPGRGVDIMLDWFGVPGT